MSAAPRLHFARFLSAALCLLLVASPSSAADLRFTDTLSPAEQTGTGVARLSPAQRTALDAQIAREIELARQGDVVAFSKTFLQRRTPAQFSAAGVADLSPDERAQLDLAVARAIARRPASTAALRYTPKNSDAKSVETGFIRPELHGEVSLTYGTAGGGRSYYGGSLTTFYDDPAHHLAIAFTYAEYHGKGLLPFCEPDRAGCLR